MAFMEELLIFRFIRFLKMVLVGGIFICLSHLINGLFSLFIRETFLFPATFACAAAYGWWSRNRGLSFLVGFLSIPYMIPFPMYCRFGALTALITNLLGLTKFNFIELMLFYLFGCLSGLIGCGFANLSRLALER